MDWAVRLSPGGPFLIQHRGRRLKFSHFTDSMSRRLGLEASQGGSLDQERRGLRFAFTATAEIAPENSPIVFAPAHVTELSLRGCFVETAKSFEIQCPILVKIHSCGEYCEAVGSVLYVSPSGMGLVFREVKPQFGAILQKWILTALDSQLNIPETPD